MFEIKVFIVGFGPDGPGSVEIFLTVISEDGGSKFENPNFMVAFFTGKMPTDYKFLSPKT